ncbi:MAG: thiamine phosphate synthase [Candidatus Velamenicoccus archaeovorus]
MGRRSLSLGVYVLTSSGLVPGRGHREVALAAIEGGADAVQLRAPQLGDPELEPIAHELAGACRDAGVLFVVNDRVDVALRSGADGVHLGQGDGLEGARERLGPEAVLGVSVATPEQARAAHAAGADYLGVTVWATPTKPEAEPRGLDGLRAVVAATRLPVVGIGGIDASNAAAVLGTGAAGVAVISAVGAAPDPVAATRELVEIVRSSEREVRGR